MDNGDAPENESVPSLLPQFVDVIHPQHEGGIMNRVSAGRGATRRRGESKAGGNDSAVGASGTIVVADIICHVTFPNGGGGNCGNKVDGREEGSGEGALELGGRWSGRVVIVAAEKERRTAALIAEYRHLAPSADGSDSGELKLEEVAGRLADTLGSCRNKAPGRMSVNPRRAGDIQQPGRNRFEKPENRPRTRQRTNVICGRKRSGESVEGGKFKVKQNATQETYSTIYDTSESLEIGQGWSGVRSGIRASIDMKKQHRVDLDEDNWNLGSRSASTVPKNAFGVGGGCNERT
ncbi:hypothetical protein C8R45DRAFT_942835 [Mycena sanguinolenta]|nr:hypothetical protein C8R45DRAFT_942835 [Mycena sanguinolenta]